VKKETKYGIYAIAIGIIAYYLFKAAQYGTERMNSQFKYFSWSEFDSKDAPGSGKLHMCEAFVRKLDAVRECAGFPFIITSGYRTTAHNAAVGGVPGSSHTKGLAVDIAAITESQKRAIAQCAIRNGITRIGWGKTFIHLDLDTAKTQRTVWGYGNSFPSYLDLTQNLA
jgi:zinc D-Ala-D-Ala carboxypeptidase